MLREVDLWTEGRVAAMVTFRVNEVEGRSGLDLDRSDSLVACRSGVDALTEGREDSWPEKDSRVKDASAVLSVSGFHAVDDVEPEV